MVAAPRLLQILLTIVTQGSQSLALGLKYTRCFRSFVDYWAKLPRDNTIAGARFPQTGVTLA